MEIAKQHSSTDNIVRRNIASRSHQRDNHRVTALFQRSLALIIANADTIAIITTKWRSSTDNNTMGIVEYHSSALNITMIIWIWTLTCNISLGSTFLDVPSSPEVQKKYWIHIDCTQKFD